MDRESVLTLPRVGFTNKKTTHCPNGWRQNGRAKTASPNSLIPLCHCFNE